MKNYLGAALLAALSLPVVANAADSEVELLKRQLEALKKDYESRIARLEKGLAKAQTEAAGAVKKVERIAETTKENQTTPGQNSFNPAISLILDGRFASFDNDPDEYVLPGFALGNEAGLGEDGFSLGHTELIASANIDNLFFGQLALAIDEHEGETEVELEEAFIQTLGLGNGFTLKAGRFYSAIGYLNEQHEHMWDFADAPLIYRGLFGDNLIDDGVQLSYVAPTDLYLQIGGELLRGSRFPAGDDDGVGAWTVFADIGGDIGIEHSWMAGASFWSADRIVGRTSGGHDHGGGAEETPSFTGDSRIAGVYGLYKWAPNGNPAQQNLKLQFEYFKRDETGDVVMLDSGPPVEMTDYDGEQSGWYAQATYLFRSNWRAGIRYDRLDSDNRGSDMDVLDEAGLFDNGHNPERFSAMIEWLPSEFSRLRLQFNRDESQRDGDNQLFLQYTHSLGSHGAHQY